MPSTGILLLTCRINPVSRPECSEWLSLLRTWLYIYICVFTYSTYISMYEMKWFIVPATFYGVVVCKRRANRRVSICVWLCQRLRIVNSEFPARVHMAYIGKGRSHAQVAGPTVIRTKSGLNPDQKCFDRPHRGEPRRAWLINEESCLRLEERENNSHQIQRERRR